MGNDVPRPAQSPGGRPGRPRLQPGRRRAPRVARGGRPDDHGQHLSYGRGGILRLPALRHRRGRGRRGSRRPMYPGPARLPSMPQPRNEHPPCRLDPARARGRQRPMDLPLRRLTHARPQPELVSRIEEPRPRRRCAHRSASGKRPWRRQRTEQRPGRRSRSRAATRAGLQRRLDPHDPGPVLRVSSCDPGRRGARRRKRNTPG